MKVGFKMKDVLELVQWNAAHTQAPSRGEIWEPQYYASEEVPMKNGFPDHTKIINSRLQRGLCLCKDSGLYLMAGTSEVMPARQEAVSDTVHVVYAIGCNPSTDKNYRALSDKIMGKDCESTNIPVEWVQEFAEIDPEAEIFYIDLAPSCINFLKPEKKRRDSDAPSP